MAVGNVSSDGLRLAERDEGSGHRTALRYHVLPLSLLILALVVITGVAFFRSDFWLMGATFIAGGFLTVSSLLYVASKELAHPRAARAHASTRPLGTGVLSTGAGLVSLLAVTGDIGASLGSYTVFVQQLGFALVVMGAFWLSLSVRELF